MSSFVQHRPFDLGASRDGIGDHHDVRSTVGSRLEVSLPQANARLEMAVALLELLAGQHQQVDLLSELVRQVQAVERGTSRDLGLSAPFVRDRRLEQVIAKLRGLQGAEAVLGRRQPPVLRIVHDRTELG